MVQKKAVKKVAKKVVKKGDVYKCGACGLVATADEVCGCVDACDIICCERQMKPSKDTASSPTGRPGSIVEFIAKK